MRRWNNYICKFCGWENKNAGIRCDSCHKYQKENLQNNNKNKVIDIMNKSLSGWDAMIGKEIKNVNHYAGDSIAIITFTDDSWIALEAEIDEYGCQCASAELTYNSRQFNSKEKLIKIGLWKEEK